MSTQIIEDTDTIESLDFKHVPPCEGDDEVGEKCGLPAKFICLTSCCAEIFLLCEDCFFFFLEFAKMHVGETYACVSCDNNIIIHPGHLKVIGRV